MSQFYNPRRTRNLFDPNSEKPFEISRSKLELFVECPRCFYLDRRLGIARPSGPSFSLNSAVDGLLKKEFDIHRVGQRPHPLMETYNINAVPFQHQKMNEWRYVFSGVRVFHPQSNFIVYGAVDDIWVNTETKSLFIVDYKSTSTEKEITLDEKWKEVYKRQMEIYQWLARHNQDLKKYQISDTGYFVYCNGRKDPEAFDGKLEFDIKIIPYNGNDSWVEEKIVGARQCLMKNEIPPMDKDCDFCRYREEIRKTGA